MALYTLPHYGMTSTELSLPRLVGLLIELPLPFRSKDLAVPPQLAVPADAWCLIWHQIDAHGDPRVPACDSRVHDGCGGAMFLI